MNELDRLVLVLDFNLALCAGFKELLHESGAAREALVAHDAAGAAEARIGHRTNLAELHADVAFEPVDAVGVAAVERLVAHLLRDVHHHGVEGIGRVFEALFLLVARAPAADGAERIDGVAVRAVHLFADDDLRAQVMGGNGGDEARGAGAEDDGVVFGVELAFGLLGLGLSGARDAERSGASRAEERCLQNAAAAQFDFGHDGLPSFGCWRSCFCFGAARLRLEARLVS